jgi:hypothetical protein
MEEGLSAFHKLGSQMTTSLWLYQSLCLEAFLATYIQLFHRYNDSPMFSMIVDF